MVVFMLKSCVIYLLWRIDIEKLIATLKDKLKRDELNKGIEDICVYNVR